MSIKDENRNTVALIKKLLADGYTQKQIGMITKENQSKIQRIAAGTTYQYVSKHEYSKRDFYEMNKKNLDHILTVPEMSGHGPLTDQDKNYIRLLKYCGLNYMKVRWQYADRPHWEVRQVWTLGDPFELDKFNAQEIGIPNIELKFLLS